MKDQNDHDFFRKFLNIHEFFGIFVCFSNMVFKHSFSQLRDIAQKIHLNLPNFLSYVSVHGEARGGRERAKILILRGLKLRRFDQNQGNHRFEIV